MCLGMFLLGTLPFLVLGDSSLSQFRDVFSYYILKYFLRPFLSLIGPL